MDTFTLWYCYAALWTTDANLPGGCDYVKCGRAEEMLSTLPKWFTDRAKVDCEKFQSENQTDLSEYDDDEKAGMDFWLSRGGFGSGFCDYNGEDSERLHKAAKAYGEVDLLPEDIGQESESD